MAVRSPLQASAEHSEAMLSIFTAIVLLTILGLVLAAKRRGSSMKGYQKLPFTESAAVGAVATGTVSATNLTDSVNARTRVSSVKATYAIRDFTAGEGPITFGWAHSDYSNTEIEEALEAANSWDRGDKVAREQANRLVRIVGGFEIEDDLEEKFAEGRMVTTKLNWTLEEGDTLKSWVYAKGGALTTGGILSIQGHANGWAA